MPSKVSEVAVVKCPTTTTGMFAWKSCGGDPCATTYTWWSPEPVTTKDAPLDVRVIVPGFTTPSRRITSVPNDARLASTWSTVSK